MFRASKITPAGRKDHDLNHDLEHDLDHDLDKVLHKVLDEVLDNDLDKVLDNDLDHDPDYLDPIPILCDTLRRFCEKCRSNPGIMCYVRDTDHAGRTRQHDPYRPCRPRRPPYWAMTATSAALM